MKKVVETAEVIAAKQRMAELIEDNSEKRVYVSDVDNLYKAISTTQIVEQPELIKSVFAVAALFFGYDYNKTMLAFKRAKVTSIETGNGMIIPQYQFVCAIGCLNDKSVALKADVTLQSDTASGLVITDFTFKRLSAEFSDGIQFDSSISFPVSLGEKNVSLSMLDFMVKALPKIAEDDKVKARVKSIRKLLGEISE